jgi:hypothetical protein
MGEEYGTPRDVDTDLAEITSRLGEPLATYRTNARRTAWRLTVGVLLLIVGAASHYAVWSGEVPLPRHAHLWKIIALGLIGAPTAGSYLIYFAVRGLKLWVLEYPTGLFIWHRGRVLGFPWDEMQVVQFRGLSIKSVLNRTDDTVWFGLDRSERRLFGTTLKLTRVDGEQVSIPSTLDDFPNLGRHIQEETYRRLFPEHLAALRNGQTVAFGPITCNQDGITVGRQSLSWRQVGDVVREADRIQIRRVGKKKPWSAPSVNTVANPHVLIGIVDASRTIAPPK